MKTTPFRVTGALTDEHADIYIERQADRATLTHLRAMDYLLVIEPRQQGKTSLINRLMYHPGLQDFAFVYLDMTTPDRSSERTWYQTLCPRILRQLSKFISHNQRLAIPKKSTAWREFLCEVAICAVDAHKRVVIALDEIGAVAFPGATEFFSVLRDVYNSRQAETELKQLTFLLAGAFHPRDLIKDEKISPFNIAQRVRLDDFTLVQVQELVGKGDWSAEQVIALAEQIHYWTDGQPYLTQMLCSYLGPGTTTADVDACVEQLRREDENHLPPLIDRLQNDERLCRYTARILTGERIKFYPREHRRQAQLELLGVIKEGPEGFCVIRNRIYKHVLPQALGFLELLKTSPIKENSPTQASTGSDQEASETEPDHESEMKMDTTPKSTPYSALEGALDRGTLALFIGADLPSKVTGLPSRADLARELARRKELDESLPLAEVAQRVSQAGNRWEFTAFIRDALDTTGKSPQPFHRRIVELVQEHGIETLITTAYDNLLELAFQEAGVPINSLVRGSDVSFIAPDRPTLVKLYGDVQQPDTLIVTADDHYGLWRDREKEDLLHEVRTVLRRQTVLFLGYNLADPDFNLLWREVLDRAGRFARTAYAVWTGLPEGEVRMWRDRGIVILEADPMGVLTAFEGSPAPAGHLESMVGVPTLEPSTKGEDMDYKLGFQTLKACLAKISTELQSEVATLEERFWKNQRAERLFGGSENTRNERSQIIFSLNGLALKHCAVSFNELCQGAQPVPEKTSDWRNPDIMNPESFVEQSEVSGLVQALMKFAARFQVASDRQDILAGAGVDSSFATGLRFDTSPVAFANSLLAKFRGYRVSEQRLDYHPMVTFLSYLLDTGPTNYGLEDPDVGLCKRLVKRGKENLRALQLRTAVGRIESPLGTSIGTGVLVEIDLLLTCHHVFSKHKIQQAWVRFGYTTGSYGLEDPFELDLKNFVSTRRQPDYALIRIKGEPNRQVVKPVDKVLSSGLETCIRIIHYPQGKPVVVSSQGQIIQVGPDYIHHNVSTSEGSSGAPIFDQDWELIAIHRGQPGVGRDLPPETTEGVPIHAIWDRILPYLHE